MQTEEPTVPDFEEIEIPEGSSLLPFMVDVEGFEGPIDVLLTLARDQKVDLVHISIVKLADQYLEFVTEARQTNLELAADYLVMAAWLAYLKSRLLLPDLSNEEEPTGAELAAALQFQLQRLQSMQEAGSNLMKLPRLKHDFFARGEPEKFTTTANPVFESTLHDLISAYSFNHLRKERGKSLHIEASWDLHSVEDAIVRLRAMVGYAPDWQRLFSFLPDDVANPLTRRSATASTFVAALELAKAGRVKLRQTDTFGSIEILTTERWDAPEDELPENETDGISTDETDDNQEQNQ
ncbi:MAG: segregation/condensation protein A [Rhodospirillaceae bacterium]|nr:segregation/condensation protein A [Rhodospirillaceae bacterium]